ncbi:hypothetical protein EW146_g7017 [Bondarzewia mesenterica]|uniref:Integrase catalytic domain-containing protein n=1 Tax=Bondarzewia mesenterica TaxID=1095465 RepID=A0A4S4LLZ2_9AGAM|nr:hypothetical protein EW146_g7017 [Bondarzewia mesenterica]
MSSSCNETAVEHEQYDIIDLYTVADPNSPNKQCTPFVHEISLDGPNGEVVRMRSLFDDGAMVGAMCSTIFAKIKHRLSGWGRSTKRLRMADGTVIKSEARWQGTIQLGSVRAKGEFEVFNSGGGWSFLFGKPLLITFNAIHNYTEDTVRVANATNSETLTNQLHLVHYARIADTMDVNLILDIKQHAVIPEGSPHSSKQPEPTQPPNVAYVNTETDSSDAGVEQLHLPQLSNDPSIFTRHTDPQAPARVAALLKAIRIGTDLTPDQRTRVENLIEQKAAAFALSISEREWLYPVIDEMTAAGIITPIAPENIKCVSAMTLAQKAHDAESGLTIEELQHRLNDECIAHNIDPTTFDLPSRPALQPATTTPKPIPKPKWRICQNYDQLNRVTQVPPMPQGDIRLKQQRLCGHRWVSVFDFASGFYAVETDPAIRPYLAFYVEGRGFYTNVRMPFGLMGAPTRFAQLTADCLGDLIGLLFELFVDDGGMAGDDFEEKLRHLSTLLQQIIDAGLSLSATKCQFFMTEAVFAGSCIGADGIKPDLSKLSAVVDWPRPTTLLELSSFTGLTGHFRGLIHHYSLIARPLTDLLCNADIPKHAGKAVWRRIMRGSHLDNSAALTREPVLRGPKFDGTPFIVTTDGCKEGFGGVLAQRFTSTLPGGKAITRVHPIAFASKRTSRSEERYKPFLLEFAALKFTLDQFNNVIWGFPIELETDCQALRDFILNTDLNATHARWRDGILGYNIVDVRHIPGRINLVRDGLSRQSENTDRRTGDGSDWSVEPGWETSTGLVHDLFYVTESDTTEANYDALRKRYALEPLWMDTIDALLGHNTEKSARIQRRAKHHANGYLIEGDTLWRLGGGIATRARARRECITQTEAVERAHLQHTSNGHWGRDLTKLALLDVVCSPKLDQSIITALQECPQCKNFGATHLHSLLEPITRRHPLELLIADYLKLPTGKGGYHTLGVWIDTMSQHLWAFKYKASGTAKTTLDGLDRIQSQARRAPETFMTDGRSHFNNDLVRNWCTSADTKYQLVSAYSPWVNGLIEGSNKLLLRTLKCLCAPDLGEDGYVTMTDEQIPRSWPDHLDEALRSINNRILPALKFSPTELFFSLIINIPLTPTDYSTTPIKLMDVVTHVAYIKQQHLDSYHHARHHAAQRKAAFDKKSPPVNDLEYTFKASRKLLPRWSEPYRVVSHILNSYTVATLNGTLLRATIHARRLWAFIPRPGTLLSANQNTFIASLHMPNEISALPNPVITLDDEHNPRAENNVTSATADSDDDELNGSDSDA